jgi:hypothetical protein
MVAIKFFHLWAFVFEEVTGSIWWNASEADDWLFQYRAQSEDLPNSFIHQANWTCFQYNGLQHEISLQLLFVNLNNNQTRSWVLGEKWISRGVKWFLLVERWVFVFEMFGASLVYQLLVDADFGEGPRGIPGFCLLPLRLSSSILGLEVHLHGRSTVNVNVTDDGDNLPNRLWTASGNKEQNLCRNFKKASKYLPLSLDFYRFCRFLSWNTLNLSWCARWRCGRDSRHDVECTFWEL